MYGGEKNLASREGAAEGGGGGTTVQNPNYAVK